MTATRELIAAALTLADIDEHVAEMPTTAAADVREMCARAMVQPVSATDVPMPEPTTAQHRFRHPQKLMPGWSVWQPCEVQERPTWKIDSVGYEVEYRVLFSPDQMRTYGDAREAAGYARGLREMLDCRTCRNYTRGGCIQTAQCVDGDGYRRAMPVRFWSAALRGEVG